MSGQAGAVAEREREILVTPEMVEIGVAILAAADYRVETQYDVVKDILFGCLKSNL